MRRAAALSFAILMTLALFAGSARAQDDGSGDAGGTPAASPAPGDDGSGGGGGRPARPGGRFGQRRFGGRQGGGAAAGGGGGGPFINALRDMPAECRDQSKALMQEFRQKSMALRDEYIKKLEALKADCKAKHPGGAAPSPGAGDASPAAPASPGQ